LENISKSYKSWQEETGVKLIAISIDRERQLEKVKALVQEKSWDYEVYMDQSGAFRDALNVVNIPHTFVLDGEGKIVYQSTSYNPGDELKLFEKIKAILSGSP
jgi:peroxiredoxin